MNTRYDAIVIGAGSVGAPIAYYLALEKLKTLVIDRHASVGQGQNKSAIGGVRATHSDPAKIMLCRESLHIFREWQDTYGYDIGWKQGGYCFPVYDEQAEQTLKNLLPFQKAHGLDINWVDGETIRELVPGINEDHLIGGTYSPGDGQVSPLLFIDSMYREAVSRGCVFRFHEEVTAIQRRNGRVTGLSTNKERYTAPVVVNAAGAFAGEIGKLTDLHVPVLPESHEAGITSPVEHFLVPMVVDMSPGPEGKTANFYFAQVHEGPVIFCYTPLVPFSGLGRGPTSEFLPVLASRLIHLLPRCSNLLIRRVWRGIYPMTPDGYPICGRVDEIEGMYLAAGMCGQGFMLGPGLGRNMAELITTGHPLIPKDVFDTLGFKRNFYGMDKEALT